MQRRGTSAAAGFTLFELIVVIAIIGVVLTAATPRFLRSLDVGRLRSEATTLLTTIRFAQGMAAVQRATYVVHFDLARQSYRLTREASRGDDFDLNDQDMLGGQSSLFPGESAHYLPTPAALPQDSGVDEGATSSNRNATGNVDIFDEEQHVLARGVRITRISDDRGEEFTDGEYSLPLDPKGCAVETKIFLSTEKEENNAELVVKVSYNGQSQIVSGEPNE